MARYKLLLALFLSYMYLHRLSILRYLLVFCTWEAWLLNLIQMFRIRRRCPLVVKIIWNLVIVLPFPNLDGWSCETNALDRLGCYNWVVGFGFWRRLWFLKHVKVGLNKALMVISKLLLAISLKKDLDGVCISWYWWTRQA